MVLSLIIIVAFAVLIVIGIKRSKRPDKEKTWYERDREASYEKERAAREELYAKIERCAACANRSKCSELAKRNSLSCSSFRIE